MEKETRRTEEAAGLSTGMPVRLREAVRAYRERGGGPVALERRPAAAGDLVVAVCDEVARVVLVSEVYETHLTIMLCHPYVEMAADYDVIVKRPGSYDLVVGVDLYGVILKEQVKGVIGAISERLLSMARSSLWNDGETSNSGALPLQGPSDPRWRFKEDELTDLEFLRKSAHEVLLKDW